MTGLWWDGKRAASQQINIICTVQHGRTYPSKRQDCQTFLNTFTRVSATPMLKNSED